MTRDTAKTDRIDRLAILVIVLLSAAPYVAGLGFYSDDWNFLADFTSKIGRSPFDFVSIGFSYPAMVRPLQGIWGALLFKLFGVAPLPYHVCNTLIFAACAVLVNILARNLGWPRRLAFATAIIFILLPQLSTVRLWFATFQITLSLLFFLVACLADLRWARTGELRWKLGSLVAAVACLGSYELFGPLLLGFAAVTTWIRYRKSSGRDHAALWAAFRPQLANVAVVVVAVVLKGHFSPRVGQLDWPFFKVLIARFIDPFHDWRIDNGISAKSLIIVNFWDTIALPFASFGRMIIAGTILWPLLAAAAIAAICWWRLINGDDEEIWPHKARQLLWIGVALFVLGFATFLISGAVAISPAGIANRTASAAALGVALILVVPLLLFARQAQPNHQRRRFAAAVAFFALLLSLRISDIGQHWNRAEDAQAAILDSARRDLAGVPAGSTVILDGICPYVGSGIVFEAPWDVPAALSLLLDRRIRGDIITDRARWNADAIRTVIYGEPHDYPYGPGLFIYNPGRHWLVPITDQPAANAYRARTGRFAIACRRGFVARGVPM